MNYGSDTDKNQKYEAQKPCDQTVHLLARNGMMANSKSPRFAQREIWVCDRSIQSTRNGDNSMNGRTTKNTSIPFVPLSLLALLWSMSIDAQDATANSGAADPSPHKSGFVTVNGIKLHYLDWGGNSDALVLLTGGGDDAHVFDGFAEKFTDRYRVIALTRRGYGESDAPYTGYDTATRVEDIHQFLDALKIKIANIAGHSMGGSEMTVFASLYPKRVKKLVYLDGANDQTCYAKVEIEPWLSPVEKHWRLEARSSLDSTEVPVGVSIERWRAIKATGQALDLFRPDYSKVKAPALAIYRRGDRYDVPRGTPVETRKVMDAWWMKNGYQCAVESMQQFQQGMRRSEIVQIQYTYHYVFVGPAQNEVVPLMREFLLK
jgi:pimeloyl-ACP methyl ester carboxylesterase